MKATGLLVAGLFATLLLALIPLVVLHRTGLDVVEDHRTVARVEHTRLKVPPLLPPRAAAAAAAPRLMQLPGVRTAPAAPAGTAASTSAVSAVRVPPPVAASVATAAAVLNGAGGAAAAAVPSAAQCANTVHGRDYVADDQGFVCRHEELDYASGCCLVVGAVAASATASLSGYARHACETCGQNACCRELEFCVACCLHPARVAQAAKLVASGSDPARPVVAPGRINERHPISHKKTARDSFRACHSRCRANSRNNVHMNAYRSPAHHCFDLAPLAPPTATKGAVGQNCREACEADGGAGCFAAGFAAINTCAQMKAAFGCAAGCEKSFGGDQPAYVDDAAAPKWRPRTCLVQRDAAKATCDGKHEATRRLCPCARSGLPA